MPGFLPLLVLFIHSFWFPYTMARTKQATPLRREPSSEYYNKANAPETQSRSAGASKDISNGSVANGHANVTTLQDLLPLAQKEAGALQFIIAVGGIYGAL